jgi:hypothetical protein
MSEKKKEYQVISPIKRGGKRHEIGDTLLLTKEEADGLHVTLAGESSGKAETESGPTPSPSMGLNATAAIKTIEGNELKDIKGFVVAAPQGTEDRKTVLDAWQAKQAGGKPTDSGKEAE